MADILVRRPFAPLRRLRSELDRIFEDVFPDGWTSGEGENGSRVWTPRMDLSETETEYLAKMDLPGLAKDDVSVKVENRKLIVSGERKEELRDEGENFLRIERSYGSFYRSFPLPENAKSNAIDAEIKNGVLMVHIPKSEKEKVKTVKVK